VDRQLLAMKLNVIEVICTAGHQKEKLDFIFLHQVIKKATLQEIFNR